MSVVEGTLSVMARKLTAAFGQQLKIQANYPGVYISATSQFQYRGRLWAVVLYAGRGAVLSHETAAWLHGFGKLADATHVTIPDDRRVREPDGVRVHRSGRFFEAAMRQESPPRTSPAETVLDLVNESGAFTDVCGWVSRAISAGATDEEKLLAAMRRRKRLRWRNELESVIVAVGDGDQSALEAWYTFGVERRHRLPESERQVPFTKADRTRGRRDRLYREYGVIVELDGKVGHDGEQVSQDKARDRAAAGTGQQTVRFEWKDVHGAPCKSAAEVAAVLRARGWTGDPRPCSLSCGVASRGRGRGRPV
jgi:hypothetical protein